MQRRLHKPHVTPLPFPASLLATQLGKKRTRRPEKAKKRSAKPNSNRSCNWKKWPRPQAKKKKTCSSKCACNGSIEIEIEAEKHRLQSTRRMELTKDDGRRIQQQGEAVSIQRRRQRMEGTRRWHGQTAAAPPKQEDQVAHATRQDAQDLCQPLRCVAIAWNEPTKTGVQFVRMTDSR